MFGNIVCLIGVLLALAAQVPKFAVFDIQTPDEKNALLMVVGDVVLVIVGWECLQILLR